MNRDIPRRSARAIAVLLSLISLLGLWYVVAANYDYSALAGTYVLDQNGEKSTLRLWSDRTFTQELVRSGSVQKAQGIWYRYGESHVSFSREFLTVSGQALNADGQAHGEFGKTLGVLTFLTLAPLPDGPRFQKTLLR
jgi:hypothetical protein